MVKGSFTEMQRSSTYFFREQFRLKAKIDVLQAFVFTRKLVAKVATLIRDVASEDFDNFTIKTRKFDVELDGDIFREKVILKSSSFLEQSIRFDSHSSWKKKYI